MRKVQFVTFVENKQDVFAAMLALRSLQVIESPFEQPIILIAQDLYDAFHAEYPDLKLNPIFNKLGANLTTSFSKGYNWNLGYRPAMSRMLKALGDGDAMFYFSPRSLFLNLELFEHFGDETWAAKQPDDFWPERDIYGPTLDEIWQSVLNLADASLSDWIEEDFPDGYWRRYPTASPHLFYTPNPTEFTEIFGELNDGLSENIPFELEGLGHIPREAVLAATIVKMGGKIIDPLWDIDIIYYHDFYNLLLRLNDDHVEWLNVNILEENFVRRFMKSVDEYKLLFYQGRIPKIRENLSMVERNFSINRMEELIRLRRVRQQIKKRLKNQQNKSLV